MASHPDASRAALVLTLLAACACPKEAGPKPGATQADSQAPSDFAKLYWPPAKPFVNSPVVSVSASGQRTVEQFQFPAATWSAFEAAEKAFGAKDYAEGERRYREVLDACPTCYPALIGLGDCELGQGKPRDAIDHYREAEQLNPDDFLGFFSEADAIGRLGNFGEARELLIRALVLRPGRPTVLKVLHLIEERIGAVVDDEPLRPKAAFTSANNISVTVPKDDPAKSWWIVYAICKGATERKQQAREVPLLPPSGPWNSQQEELCLRMAARAYSEKRSAKGADPALERFLTADAAGLAQGFVLYEVASQVDPQIALEVSPEQRKLIDRYVRTIVVRDRGR